MLKAFAFYLCISCAFADDLKLGIEQFNFEYQTPHGLGTAASFSHNMKSLNEEGLKIEVEKIDEVFKFHVSGSENQDLELKDAPSFIQEAESMKVENLNFKLEDSLALSLIRGQFISKNDDLDLENFTLNCSKDHSLTLLEDQLISGCIQAMVLKSNSFSSESRDKGHLVSALNRAFLKSLGADKANLGIKKLELLSTGGKFNLSAEVKAQVSGKAKGKGTFSYDPTAKKLTVKIDEVKFGILNVTSMVFDELKKSETEKLIVSKPYVYLLLK